MAKIDWFQPLSLCITGEFQYHIKCLINESKYSQKKSCMVDVKAKVYYSTIYINQNK